MMYFQFLPAGHNICLETGHMESGVMFFFYSVHLLPSTIICSHCFEVQRSVTLLYHRIVILRRPANKGPRWRR